MKKQAYLWSAAGFLLMATAAMAQLPANPWDIKPNDGYKGDNVAETDITQAPVYQDTANGSDILPVDPGPEPAIKAESKPGAAADSTES